MFWLRLEHATKIERDEDGRPWTWRSGETIAEFRNPEAFKAYVVEHINELKNAAAFTGSASLIVGANAYLGEQLKKAGVI
jgi:hypothetical protein